MSTLALPALFKTNTSALPLAAMLNANGKDSQKLKDVAQDFEAQFLSSMFSDMVSQLQGDGPLGDEGIGADAFRGLLTDELGKSVAKSGGIGIAPSIYSELLKLQELKG